jgi:SAM-dependent methyltransferase
MSPALSTLARAVGPFATMTAHRAHQRYIGWREGAAEGDQFVDGERVPPDELIRLVAGTQTASQWLQTGRADARLITELLRRNGVAIADVGALLDFGCGCGRVLRCWDGVRGSVNGCDYDGRLARWTRSAFPQHSVRINGSRPPLPYRSGSLDLVYALSVLTHLGPEAQVAWLRDLRRILKPTGLLIFTVHGDRFTPLLDAREWAAYDRDGNVTRNAALEGQEGCAAFNAPHQVTQRLLPAAGLELVDALYEDISDEGPYTKPILALQDAYLVRRA